MADETSVTTPTASSVQCGAGVVLLLAAVALASQRPLELRLRSASLTAPEDDRAELGRHSGDFGDRHPRDRHPVPVAALDLNRASVEELERLPGVGPVIAARIVAHRERRRFARVEQLRAVPGVGPVKLARLQRQGLVSVEPKTQARRDREEQRVEEAGPIRGHPVAAAVHPDQPTRIDEKVDAE